MSNWQEEFDNKFGLTDNSFPKEIPARPFETYQEIRHFISDLRKHDQEELIRMLDADEEYVSGGWRGDEKNDEGFIICIKEIKQLIKDYYEK